MVGINLRQPQYGYTASSNSIFPSSPVDPFSTSLTGQLQRNPAYDRTRGPGYYANPNSISSPDDLSGVNQYIDINRMIAQPVKDPAMEAIDAGNYGQAAGALGAQAVFGKNRGSDVINAINEGNYLQAGGRALGLSQGMSKFLSKIFGF